MTALLSPQRWLAAVVLVAMVSVTAAAACGSGADDSTPANRLPDIELERLDGGVFSLNATGHARVLNLWATWCAPCRSELPAFDQVAADIAGTDGAPAIIGINVGDTGDQAADLVRELGLRFEQVLDPRAQIQRTLRITGLPATIVVGVDGDVLDVHHGELTRDELEALLDQHFALGLSV